MTGALRILNGQIFQPDGSFAVANLLVDGGQIVAVEGDEPDGWRGEAVDAKGSWILPGLIDLHAHMSFIPGVPDRATKDRRSEVALKAAAKALRALAYGITTVRDLGGYGHVDLALRDAVAAGTVPGPRMLCAGSLLTMTGGHCYKLGHEADGPEGMAKAAREELRAGADHLKLMCSGGLARVDENPGRSELTAREIGAAVEVARAAGRVVAAHAHPVAAVRLAAEAGVASIEHGSFIDADCATTLRGLGTFVVPTFAIYEHLAASSPSATIAARSREVIPAKRKSFDVLASAGVKWGVGTDAGSFMDVSGYVRELEIIHDLGVSRREVLLAATSGNAELLQLHDCGILEVGRRADLFAVPSNPLEGFEPLRAAEWTVAAGRLHRWPVPTVPLPSWMLSVMADADGIAFD